MATNPNPQTPFQSQQLPPQKGGMSIGIIIAVVLGVLLLGMAMLAMILFPAVTQVRSAARRVQAKNNVRQMCLAMHNFASAHGGRFPANLKGDDGNDVLSWRLELLPLLVELDGVWESIDRQSAWDSPANKAHTEVAIPFYQSPRATSSRPNATHFVAVNDPNAPLYGDNGSFDSIGRSDETGSTALFLECVDSKIAWAEPRDVTIAEAIRIIQNSQEPGGTVVALADGTTGVVDKSASAEDITKLFLLGDGAPGNPIVSN